MASRWVHPSEDERQQARSSFCEVSSNTNITLKSVHGTLQWALMKVIFGDSWAHPGFHVFILPVWCRWRGEECVWRFGPAVCASNNSRIVLPFPASLQIFSFPSLFEMSDLCRTLVVLSVLPSFFYTLCSVPMTSRKGRIQFQSSV